MANQQESTGVTTARVIETIRSIVPPGSYVLFTPYDGMVVSPDPEQIKRSIDVLTSQLKGKA